jgi:16S rRNA (uracil1498-N3)-methyltransferase
MTRIFQSVPLKTQTLLTLDEAASHHLARVLRAKVGESITLFNGEGGEYQTTIHEITKKNIQVKIHSFIPDERESSLELYLAQGISRGEKMDYTIQKAVELGVKKIFPLLTERCNVKLDEDRREKRLQHWRSIIIGACEQSGRNRLPELFPAQTFQEFILKTSADWKFVLAPLAAQKLSSLAIPKTSSVVLCIGPEGGLSDSEIKQAEQQQFIPLNLGPRILRTETAAVAALATLQFHCGELG